MSDTIFNVDATALFNAAPAPDLPAVLAALNTAFSDDPACHFAQIDQGEDTSWVLTCDLFHIRIGFETAPAPMARFAHAITSPINRLRHFEYDHVVQHHAAHLTISIRAGSGQDADTSGSCDPVLKMKALHVTAQALCATPGFLALHFVPSDRLLSAEDLRGAAGQDIPTDLLLHPVPTETDTDAYGRETWALRQKNPACLPVPAIEIEGIPRAVPLATAVNLLRTLTRAFEAGRIGLNHNDTISPTGKWALHVFRMPPQPTTPLGRIVLSFYKDRVAYAPLATDPGLLTAETAPQDTADGFAAKALAALRHTGDSMSQITEKTGDPTATQQAELRPIAAPAASSVAAVKPCETTSDAQQKVSLLGWMVDRCKSVPKESHAAAS